VYLGCWVTQIRINASSFPTDRDGLPPAPSPYLLRSRVHPLVSSALLQSSFWQSSARARHLAAETVKCPPRAPPLGLVPLRDINTRSPLCVGHPVPFTVPSSAFRTLSTVCSSSCLAHLFRCAAVSRVLAPGVSSSSLAAPPFGGRYPRAVGAAACRLPGSSERRVDLRVLLQTGVRSVRRGF
jgi:hypothetical protein